MYCSDVSPAPPMHQLDARRAGAVRLSAVATDVAGRVTNATALD